MVFEPAGASQLIETAEVALRAATALLDRAVASLRERSLSGGKLSGSKLDELQIESYDVALSFAEATAARFGLAYARRVADMDAGGATVETHLARFFTAEVLQTIRGRIAPRLADHGLSTADLAVTLDAPEVVAFCNDALRAAQVAALGDEVRHSAASGAYLLDEHHDMIRGEFRKFATSVVMPLAEHVHRYDALVPDAILRPLSDLGAFGISIPERFGGLQPDDRDDNLGMIVVTEELSRGSLGAAGSLITRPEIMAKSLLKGGTEEQKQRWLPRLACGDILAGVAITEPDYGSDVASMKLKATRTDGGFLLDGAKTWCTFGGKANLLLVLARTNPDMALGHKGLSLFLVEKPSFDGHDFEHTQPGGGKISGRAIATMGYRGMHSYETFFENFFVPSENLIGGPNGEGKGFYFTMAGFAGGRIQTAARAIGLMQAAYERAVAYASERRVFGKVIGDYALTRAKLARMAALLCVSRQFTYGVGRLMDEGRGDMEASLVKLFACRAAQQLCNDALQIHGGMGYAEETAVSRYFVDARVLTIFEGAEETLALKVITRALVERSP